MILPIIGEILSALGVMICLYMKRWPMEVVSLTDSLFPGLAGGWFTMLMGVFSYIADVTTEDERTLRIGIVNVSRLSSCRFEVHILIIKFLIPALLCSWRACGYGTEWSSFAVS